MKLKNWLIIFLLSGVSCAKIPMQAVDLSRALKDEGSRMHQMNLSLVEYVFNEKRQLVNEFISKEYTPVFIENFVKRLPADTDIKKELPEIIAAINPRIDARRDSLINVLQVQKMKLLGQLNDDYKLYEDAFGALQQLLASAARLNKSRTSIYEDVKKLSSNKIDLAGINGALDNFIKGAGSVGEKTILLTNTIQTLLK
ncbi:MAG: hypothetical protein EOO06_16035 [Chitinophagaceae bacterium]|nr:MAG: hypothetical protein EOO06_16035 [Chitinophagaceae bacterium]